MVRVAAILTAELAFLLTPVIPCICAGVAVASDTTVHCTRADGSGARAACCCSTPDGERRLAMRVQTIRPKRVMLVAYCASIVFAEAMTGVLHGRSYEYIYPPSRSAFAILRV